MVSSIHGRISVSKEIINLVKNIRRLFPLINNVRTEYCSRDCNREVDKIAKSVHNCMG